MSLRRRSQTIHQPANQFFHYAPRALLNPSVISFITRMCSCLCLASCNPGAVRLIFVSDYYNNNNYFFSFACDQSIHIWTLWCTLSLLLLGRVFPFIHFYLPQFSCHHITLFFLSILFTSYPIHKSISLLLVTVCSSSRAAIIVVNSSVP